MRRHLWAILIVLSAAVPAWSAVGDVFVASPGNGILRVAASTGATTVFSTATVHGNGLAFDGTGGLFVSDTDTKRVLRLDTAGNATAFANINEPAGLAFDKAGNLYAVSRADRAIYKVTPDGTKSLFVDASAQGRIRSIALDPAGNVYFDSPDSVIYRATPAGTVSAYYTGLSTSTNNVLALANDGTSALFVATSGARVVEVDSPFLAFNYRSNPDGVGALVSLAFDANRSLYAANLAKSVVEKFPAAGGYSTVGSNVSFATALTVQTVVPEPASLMLIAAGGTLLRHRRRRWVDIPMPVSSCVPGPRT